VEDRQHGAVGRRVEELVAVPAGGERAGLGLAVADDAGDDQVGIVERRAEGVAEARLSSLCCFSMLEFMPESVPSRRVFQVGMQ
jgi:hypothetical protein